ncbi:MAG TPA: transcription antitermination factor NusB [Kiritimatiellia bacterium]|nr:transcription antitermination factor NusB [Kiritimatiellia bacterium]HRU71696.1 transcription antitermination factor NusB [Kiritimatiellia bacterium]
MSSRREAIFIIARWLATQEFPDRMIPDGPDRAFITDLVYTTVRRKRSLGWVLERFLRKMPKGETEAALLVGACQLLFMTDVADYAAVNETVEAAKMTSRQTAGLVNGVLRHLQRQRDQVLAELACQPIGIRTSHPDALITRWLHRFGPEETLALCERNNEPADTWLAYPPRQGPETAERRENGGVFEKLPHGMRVEEVPGYAEGAFIVQDPGTAAAIDLLAVRPGLSVLDACAAPGGKTIQIAWRMGAPAANDPRHRLVALDLHDDRIDLIHANLARTRQDWVTVLQGDLTMPTSQELAALGPFDRILVDAPCSNSGVLRRRPDARWRWTTRRMKQLAATQALLLENALALLAPGGRLVYSTCSLEHEENRRQITVLRRAHPELVCSGVIERIPTRSDTDGAFACALDRTAPAC